MCQAFLFLLELFSFRQLEGKVVEIAKLQEVFTEKVLQQEQDIFRINETAISTSENIKTGNESIRDVKKNAKFLNVFLLNFFFKLSFSRR